MTGEPLYRLEDPRPIAAEAPYTYWLPSSAELAALGPGDMTQLVFQPLQPGRKWGAERMWVTITSGEGDELTGRLDNEPDDIPGLNPGDLVTFRRYHVIDRIWSESRSTAPPAPLIQRWFSDRCLVDACVTNNGTPVHYLYREEPEPMREGDRDPDSGWRIRGDYRGLSDEEIDAREIEYSSLGRVLNVDDSWLHLIDEPVGSRFIRDWTTGNFVPEDE